jgi:hypothetical protein
MSKPPKIIHDVDQRAKLAAKIQRIAAGAHPSVKTLRIPLGPAGGAWGEIVVERPKGKGTMEGAALEALERWYAKWPVEACGEVEAHHARRMERVSAEGREG